MADELIDIFDKNMNFLGTAMKSEAHRVGLWHKAFHSWLLRRDEQGRVLVWLQLRNKDKNIFPDKLDVSAAGHIKAGETPLDGAREIEEELGLKIPAEKLVKMFIFTEVYQDNQINNKEFYEVYLGEVTTRPDDLILQPEEVGGLLEIELNSLADLIAGKRLSAEARGVIRQNDNSMMGIEKVITMEDIAPHDKTYYLQVIEYIKTHLKK